MPRRFLARCLRKVNAGEIVMRHWDTLAVDDDGSPSGGFDFVTFVVLPGLAALGLWYAGITLRDDAVNALVGAVAILAGLLFNLLALLHGIRLGQHATADNVTFQREVLANVSYAVLFSLLTLVPLVVLANLEDGSSATAWATGISIFCVGHLSLTLVMILKRMFSLLSLDLGAR